MNPPTDQVDIWRTVLDVDSDRFDALKALLSDDERSRAERFVFEVHRRRFIVAHGWLRETLSEYTATDPNAIRFRYGSHGKPAFDSPAAESLFFNLSHSEQIAVCVVTRIGEVGVDVEHIRPLSEERIAERFFSRWEVDALHALPEPFQVEGFFNCWTRKEAYIKARGEGLSIALDSFDVSLKPGEPVRFIRIGDDPEEASRWTLKDIVVPAEYRAAVAVRCRDFRLEYRNEL